MEIYNYRDRIESYIETERQEKLYKVLLFLIKMIFIGLLFRTVLFIYPDTYPLQNAFASLIGAILSPFMGIQVNEIYLLTAKNSYIIVQDCLGWKSMAVFTAIFISSLPFNKVIENLKYLFYGLAAIALANVIRVATTVYLSEIGWISFEIIHSFLWRWGLTLVILIIWLYIYTKLLDTEGEEVYDEADSHGSEIGEDESDREYGHESDT